MTTMFIKLIILSSILILCCESQNVRGVRQTSNITRGNDYSNIKFEYKPTNTKKINLLKKNNQNTICFKLGIVFLFQFFLSCPIKFN